MAKVEIRSHAGNRRSAWRNRRAPRVAARGWLRSAAGSSANPADAASALRRRRQTSDDEARLTGDIVELAAICGRYGHRRITALLRAAGRAVNGKGVERRAFVRRRSEDDGERRREGRERRRGGSRSGGSCGWGAGRACGSVPSGRPTCGTLPSSRTGPMTAASSGWLARHGRVHPRCVGRVGRTPARLGRGARGPGRADDRARRARARPVRQRPGVRGGRGARVDHRRGAAAR